MARVGVRLNPQHDERTRAKIQTTQIVKRLTQFVKGEVEMTGAQVTAGLGLLKKTLPDLASVEHSGEVAQIHTISAEPMPDEDWERAYCMGTPAGAPESTH